MKFCWHRWVNDKPVVFVDVACYLQHCHKCGKHRVKRQSWIDYACAKNNAACSIEIRKWLDWNITDWKQPAALNGEGDE